MTGLVSATEGLGSCYSESATPQPYMEASISWINSAWQTAYDVRKPGGFCCSDRVRQTNREIRASGLNRATTTEGKIQSAGLAFLAWGNVCFSVGAQPFHVASLTPEKHQPWVPVCSYIVLDIFFCPETGRQSFFQDRLLLFNSHSICLGFRLPDSSRLPSTSL